MKHKGESLYERPVDPNYWHVPTYVPVHDTIIDTLKMKWRKSVRYDVESGKKMDRFVANILIALMINAIYVRFCDTEKT